jgi:predicted aminopeptidase
MSVDCGNAKMRRSPTGAPSIGPIEVSVLPTQARSRALSLLPLAALAALAAPLAGCRLAYVVKSGAYQAELLAAREPLDAVRASGALPPEALRALDVVADVKRFGAENGYSATDNYETLAVGWDRTIWNLTACDPLAFEAETWWFPIVGRVPYLGYFREEDAAKKEAALAAKGLDVYRRTAGAYSTLGWFRDPILPGMLTWSEADLAETVLHELAHATVWVKGSVSFNESFASFVGEEGLTRYLAARHGPDSAELHAAVAEQADAARWSALQQTLYADLDRVYRDPSLDDARRAAEKAALFATLHARIEATPFHDPARYHRAADRPGWNNARLVGFRTYNDDRPAFEALLQAEGGDLLTFMRSVARLTKGEPDPFAAIRRASAESGTSSQKSDIVSFR